MAREIRAFFKEHMLHLFFIFLVSLGTSHALSWKHVSAWLTTFRSSTLPRSNIKAGVIVLSGPITNAQAYIEKLLAFQKNAAIEAILLIIESPGGAVGSSELLYRLVKEINNEKPIVALVENYCTSGAYWIASATSCIVTPAAAQVGSIGVLSQIERHKEVKIKNQNYESKALIELFQAGRYKTLTHHYAVDLNDDDRAELNDHVQKIYEIFCKTVAQTRNLDYAKKLEWADGRVFTGEEAVVLGLADRIGGMSEALEALKELSAQRKRCIIDDVELVR